MSTATMDITGNTARTHGYHVTTTDAGDKYFVSFQGTGTLKDGVETRRARGPLRAAPEN